MLELLAAVSRDDDGRAAIGFLASDMKHEMPVCLVCWTQLKSDECVLITNGRDKFSFDKLLKMGSYGGSFLCSLLPMKSPLSAGLVFSLHLTSRSRSHTPYGTCV